MLTILSTLFFPKVSSSWVRFVDGKWLRFDDDEGCYLVSFEKSDCSCFMLYVHKLRGGGEYETRNESEHSSRLFKWAAAAKSTENLHENSCFALLVIFMRVDCFSHCKYMHESSLRSCTLDAVIFVSASSLLCALNCEKRVWRWIGWEKEREICHDLSTLIWSFVFFSAFIFYEGDEWKLLARAL